MTKKEQPESVDRSGASALLDGILKITPETCDTFGDRLPVECPPECDLVLISVDCGGGLIPKNVCLPGQVYVAKIRKLIEKTPGCLWVTVTPCRSDLHQDVWERPLARPAV